MPKPKKPAKAFRHKGEKRAHIPSAEEAGYESASAKVQGAPEQKDFPRNPIVHRAQKPDLTGFTTDELFGNAISHEELDKVSDYYTHSDGWTNRLIQGDSLLAMTSLLEREGMAGQVQCFYFDPPYGIKYGSNWQLRLNNRTVTDGQDDSLSGEPEQIKAFRDTWELGIHSYLSYLRDRLLVARELLHDSGSCFVQISDENVHLVRCLMDEVFGSANFVNQITFTKTSGQTVVMLPGTADYIVWYARNKERAKYRELYRLKKFGGEGSEKYDQVELPDGTRRAMSKEEKADSETLPKGSRIYRLDNLMSQSEGRRKREGAACWFPVEVSGREFLPNERSRWKTNEEGMALLKQAGRLQALKNTLGYVRFLEDFPAFALNNVWTDIGGIQSRSDPKVYNVQTATEAIKRCMLMTTDPGDLVLDPTCGSGTTAYVAEQWGRRWITTDTSRIALNVAKTRLMTGTFPYYQLYDQQTCDLRQGFIYKKVPHVTLGSITNNEPPAEETLYDQPLEDKKRLRVAGPLTVETLQNYEPISPEELARQREAETELAGFEDGIFEELRHAGVKTGDKQEAVKFTRIDRLSDARLHAEGWYVPAAKSAIRNPRSEIRNPKSNEKPTSTSARSSAPLVNKRSTKRSKPAATNAMAIGSSSSVFPLRVACRKSPRATSAPSAPASCACTTISFKKASSNAWPNPPASSPSASPIFASWSSHAKTQRRKAGKRRHLDLAPWRLCVRSKSRSPA